VTANEFIDLAPEDFPFRLEFYQKSTGQVVWVQDIEEPGAINIPALGEHYGPVGTRLTFSDGTSWSSDDADPET
jgi:hypothetical protein